MQSYQRVVSFRKMFSWMEGVGVGGGGNCSFGKEMSKEEYGMHFSLFVRSKRLLLIESLHAMSVNRNGACTHVRTHAQMS